MLRRIETNQSEAQQLTSFEQFLQKRYTSSSTQSVSTGSTGKKYPKITIPSIEHFALNLSPPNTQSTQPSRPFSRHQQSKSVGRGLVKRPTTSSMQRLTTNETTQTGAFETLQTEPTEAIKVIEQSNPFLKRDRRPRTASNAGSNPQLKIELQHRLDEIQRQRELSGEKSILPRRVSIQSRSQNDTPSKENHNIRLPTNSPIRVKKFHSSQSSAGKCASVLTRHSETKTHENSEQSTFFATEEPTNESKQARFFKNVDTNHSQLQGLDLDLISITGINIKAVLSSAKLTKALERDSALRPQTKTKFSRENRVAIQDTQYTPGFLKKRVSFMHQMQKSRDFEYHKIPNILMKSPETREDSEQITVAQFLKRVDLFSGFDEESLVALSFNLTARLYKYREYLCREGDAATGVWIVLEGLVVVEKEGELKGEYKVADLLGRQALDNQACRRADLVVNSPKGSYVAFLSTIDFFSFLSMKGISRGENTHEIVSFLHSIPFFQTFSDLKIYLLGTGFKYKKYYKNEIIYHKDAKANEFYMMMNGQLRRETKMATEAVNRWPISLENGEFGYRKLIRNFQVSLEILPGELFGFKEMLYQKPREETVVVSEDSEIYMMDRKRFLTSKLRVDE